ncbi:MAG: DUF4389 domain-containing protein [Bacteroidales bacterium]|nr:DUF4389 domain-containing protein [Bacteroidales bacterium]
MKLEIKHQEKYSRGELLLRTLFGWIYIMIPQGFVLFFVSIWGMILKIIAFFAVLFTGKYPKSMFEYHVGLFRWNLRLNARVMNLSDGYPAFGIKGTDENTTLEVEYPEKLSRGLLILRILFGWIYVGIPHGFILFFRYIATGVLMFIAWWAVLILGKYPAGMHNFNVGTLRWGTRVSVYLGFLTDEYPPFSGK